MILVQKGWLFWKAIDDTEIVGLVDMPTVYRSWTHAGAVAKVKRRRATRHMSQLVGVPEKEEE